MVPLSTPVHLEPAGASGQADVVSSLLPDETVLLRRYHETRDPKLRAELAERFMPLVRSIARRYDHRGEPLEDLVQVGAIGLLKAIDRFDPERGVPLSGYATPTITGEIRRHFRDTGWMVRPPRDLQELVLALNVATEELASDLGRPPTTAELAAATHRDVDEVAEALCAGTGYRAQSLDAPTGDDGLALADTMGRRDDAYPRSEARHDVLLGLQALRPRERRIVALRFGVGLSQREIADEVGVSQMHVSRLLRGALEQMRRAIGDRDPRGLELSVH